MSDTVIRVENLSKKYVIGHQSERSTSIRDAMSKGAQALVQKLSSKNNNSEFSNEEFWALKDLSFDIEQGDVVGIVGRNGAGKSTLLKILSRITEPSSGRISIKGRVASLLEVGTGFHPELTGRENIFLNGSILGMSKIEIQKKFDEIVDFSEVEKFLDTPVKRYSSGMYVRLAFAVAANLDPEILIIDEVLAVGDAQFQKKCLGKIGKVAGEGRTVIFVSHTMSSVAELCKTAVYLKKGSIHQMGLAKKIVSAYLSDLFQVENSSLEQLRLPNPELGKLARFTKIEIVSSNSASLFFGEPLVIAISVHSDKEIEDLNLGLSIFSNTGACIGSVLPKETFILNAGKEITMQLKVSNINLAPGFYYASVGLGYRGKQGSLDAISGKPDFQVLPVGKGQRDLSEWHSSWGNILFAESELVIQ